MKLNEDHELTRLHKKLKDNGTADVDTKIYLFDKTYLLESGEIIEIE